ncbi:protein cordon-bleu-like isoform X15 [Anneissia japonica]|uniref:protein cordon-bleu-like isoform X15 n=1 Tax=Anneissia japonica TaxID=1529436 RepID=UPI00142583B8|nr:protein cordon-bleu-like isoform X15 [Anneissia japonica]
MPGRKRSIKSRLSKRSKAPPPPQTLKTDQNMPDMDTTNGHAATRSGKSSTNGTKPKPNTRNLRVHMPNGKIVQATVDANLSSSDLLVMMAGKNKLNPVSHMMKVPSSSPLEESVLLKPSQCVGDINGDIVFLIAKPQKEQYTIKGVERKTAKFENRNILQKGMQPEKTIRLTVNYGTKHKMVLRINPDRTLADLLPQICEEKGVDPQHHTLRLPKSPSDNLDLSKSLTSYEINELQLVDTRVPNHVRVMILTAPKQEPSVMPELVGKKKSFFQKWKKKQSGFDVEQAPVAVAKPEVTSPTSPTRQRPATISATRVPLKDNTQISRTQTTKKRAAPKPPTPNEAAAVTAKAASRKKKAPAPPRPDGGMKSPTTDDPPKRLPDADHNMPHSSVSNEESVEAEVHSKPTDEEPVSPGNLNRIHSQRPLSPPPPPPEADDTAQFILPTPTTSPELKVDRPTFIAPPPPDEPPPEEETDDQSVCSSQNSDIEDDEAENHQAVVDVGAIASGQRHVECTCNQETGEHECILHRPQTPEGAVACAAELEAVAKDEELKKEEVDTLSSELINDKAVKEDAESIEVTVDGIENIPSQDDDKKVDVGLEDATLKLNADDENAVAIQEESSTKEDDKEVSENEKIVENSDVEINEISGTGIVNSLDVETSKQLTEEVKEDIKEEQKEDGERIDQIKQLNGESSEVSNITNGDVIPVTQKTNETEIQMKELKDKYETLQQQFATLQQQMINSQQNMLEQQKAQAGAPSLSAQDMLALQTQQMQQMQQLIQQQMLLQSQGMMKMPQIPVAMQPDSHAITPVPAETMIHKEDTKPPKPHDLQELKKSEPHSEDSKKLRSPETEKDLASAFRSLKPKPKPMKHSYIFSAARKPRSESDASQSSNMAGYEMRKRSESNPEPQQPPAIKPSETVKPSEAVKPTENINVIQENGDAEKKTPKEAIVHPNVIIIDKPEDNLKSETSVLSGRSSTIPQATVAPQPAKKSSGRTGKFIAYRNPRTEELQDIQTSGSVSKFRQMFAGNNT